MSKDECVKVVVRLRPLNSKEKAANRIKIVDVHSSLHQIQLNGPRGKKCFTFDAVFDTDSEQKDVYEEIAYPLIESVLSGYNGTIFAYGQTGCGKTFTMQGEESPPELRGIIPRSFDHIFENVEASSDTSEFLVRASYCEIYNENVRDLLSSDTKKALQLKQHPDKGVYVKDLTWCTVASSEEIDTIMRKGTLLFFSFFLSYPISNPPINTYRIQKSCCWRDRYECGEQSISFHIYYRNRSKRTRRSG
jgi:hypothetical protein